MKVFLLRAAHQSTPGIVQKIFATRQLANAEAASLVNLMMRDDGDYDIAEAYADDWEMVFGDFLEYLEIDEDDAEAPFVEIDEMDVTGA